MLEVMSVSRERLVLMAKGPFQLSLSNSTPKSDLQTCLDNH